MKRCPSLQRHGRRRGMILMEILLAMAIFGMTALGLMETIVTCAKLATENKMEMRMLLKLQSTLSEYSKVAQIQEGTSKSDPDEEGIYTEAVITKMEDIKNSEEQLLADMYHVKVTAFYNNYDRQAEVSAETIRYARLYQVTGGTQAIPNAGVTP
jgi:type II secretory pathway pseudopilin PulG